MNQVYVILHKWEADNGEQFRDVARWFGFFTNRAIAEELCEKENQKENIYCVSVLGKSPLDK